MLWEKGAVNSSSTGSAPANVPTTSALQGGQLNGSASNQGNALSASKDTQSVSAVQTDRKEISGKSAESNVEVTNEEVVSLPKNEGEQALFSLTAEEQSIIDANERFNEELEALTQENADSIVFDLGSPSAFLRSAGVHDKAMKLYGSKIIKKQKKHGFRLEELRDLPMAMADPIAVFDNHGTEGNRSILTELSTNDGNVLVAVDLGKGTDIDFNIISSAFGKDGRKILHWINKGYGTYYNKEKTLEYLHLAAPIAAASDSQELSDATKVVENFQNPPLQRTNLRKMIRMQRRECKSIASHPK